MQTGSSFAFLITILIRYQERPIYDYCI